MRHTLNPSNKIIDSQALAKYIEERRDAAGNIRAADVMAWIIGANNRIQHNHARFVNKFEVLKGSDPEIITALVDRNEYQLFDGRMLRASIKDFVSEAKP